MATSDLVDPVADKLRWAVARAVRAPSTLNSQPWRFRLGDSSIEVLADRSRTLGAIDPDGRELIISVGAALFHLRLALRTWGLDTEVARLPDPRNPDLLARVTVRPGAAPDADERILCAAITARRSPDALFPDVAVPQTLVDQLCRDAAAEGAWLTPLTEPSTRVKLVALALQADREQWGSRAFRLELARWVHSGEGDPHDGVVGYAPALRDLEGDLLDRAQRSLAPDAPAEVTTATRLADSAPLLAVLGTEGDSQLAWLRAGEALDRVLLRAESECLRVEFLNQPVEVPDLRVQVGLLTGRVGVPQFVLRVGYGEPGPGMPRRPLAEVLSG